MAIRLLMQGDRALTALIQDWTPVHVCVHMRAHTHTLTHTHTYTGKEKKLLSMYEQSSLIIARGMNWKTLIMFRPYFQLLLSFELLAGRGMGYPAAWAFSKEPLSLGPGIKLVSQQS